MIPLRLLALALVACLSAAAAQPAARADEAAIRVLEDRERLALLNGDTAALAAIWTADYAADVSGQFRVLGRHDALARVRAGRLRFEAAMWRVDRVEVLGDSAVVTGEEALVAAPGAPRAGEALAGTFRDTWHRQAGVWRKARHDVDPPRARRGS